MELSVNSESGVTIVTITGSVDSADSGALLSFFNDLIDHGQTSLVVDLSRMDFVVSMGLGVFVQTYTRLRLVGGFIRLAAVQPFILQIIKTTGLDRLLPLYDSVAEAVK